MFLTSSFHSLVLLVAPPTPFLLFGPDSCLHIAFLLVVCSTLFTIVYVPHLFFSQLGTIGCSSNTLSTILSCLLFAHCFSLICLFSSIFSIICVSPLLFSPLYYFLSSPITFFTIWS